MTERVPPLEKEEILSALRARVEAQLRGLTESQNATQEGASHAEARSEHPKDTRATEAAYLARGLADRVAQLQADLARLEAFIAQPLSEGDAVAVGALIGVEDEDGQETTYFLAPAAGGERLEIGRSVVHVLSPASPLGRDLLGRCEGDDFELDLPRGRVTQAISWVR